MRPDRDAADPPESEITVTQVRQGVRGHNVSTVLIASFAATAAAGFVLFMWVEFYSTSVGKHSLPKGAKQRAR